MFGYLNNYGFDLEGTKLRLFNRLARPTLVVALLYVWLISIRTRTSSHGLRYLVDSTDCHDLSIFQTCPARGVGLRFIDQRVTIALHFQVVLCSYR